jgi:hypothetical protein
MVHVREVEGMKLIAVAVGQALGRPVSVSMLERGNRRRVLRYTPEFAAWVARWKTAPKPTRARQHTLDSRVP